MSDHSNTARELLAAQLAQIKAIISKVQEDLYDNRSISPDERDAARVACETIFEEVSKLSASEGERP